MSKVSLLILTVRSLFHLLKSQLWTPFSSIQTMNIPVYFLLSNFATFEFLVHHCYNSLFAI